VWADLTNADFSGTNFVGVNLHWATAEGADFTNTTWTKTICPDGSNSGGNGQTCIGHL
jgi:uncharacterized protein YjbI with pentapeptide repeats